MLYTITADNFTFHTLVPSLLPYNHRHHPLLSEMGRFDLRLNSQGSEKNPVTLSAAMSFQVFIRLPLVDEAETGPASFARM